METRIEAKELRIGAYINRELGDGRSEFCIVSPNVIIEANNNSSLFSAIDLVGIELYKLGFYYFEITMPDNYIIKDLYRKNDFCLKRDENVDRWIFYRFEAEKHLIEISRFNGVHRLQNIYFFLLNEELTYKELT